MGRAGGSWSVQAMGPQVGKSLRDSGLCLNIRRAGGAIPLELQGMDSANSLFGKNRRAT